MNLQPVSIDDPRLAPYVNLHQTNLTRGSGLFVVEGPLLVERLLASRYEAASLLVDERFVAGLPEDISDKVPVYVVPAGRIERVIGFNFHRGMLACGRRQPHKPLVEWLTPPVGNALGGVPESAIQAAANMVDLVTIVVAVDIHDPGNLGGLLRNCAAFGVDLVLMSPRCADPFSRRVLRVSMGAALRLAICESADLAADFDLLRGRGVSLVATVLDERAQSLETATRPRRLAILFGNEAHGLADETVSRCDRRVTLPMARGVDSLNVAVASGIFLYHLTRVASLEIIV